MRGGAITEHPDLGRLVALCMISFELQGNRLTNPFVACVDDDENSLSSASWMGGKPKSLALALYVGIAGEAALLATSELGVTSRL